MISMHELEMEVRDYELDIQGIVNNAVYQNYLEHARHKFILILGIDFAELHENGVDPVVVRAEIDYRSSLTSRNRFIVRSRLTAVGKLRFVFDQEIVRIPDNIVCVEAKITATTLVNGRPGVSIAMHQALERFLAGSETKP